MPKKDELASTPPEPTRRSKTPGESSESEPSTSSERPVASPLSSSTPSESAPETGVAERPPETSSEPKTPSEPKGIRSKTGAKEQPDTTIRSSTKEAKDAGMQQQVQPIETSRRQPIIIDLGSLSRREIRRLKRGVGKSIEEVHQVSQRVKASGLADVPVVVLYRRKRRARVRLPFPFPFPSFR